MDIGSVPTETVLGGVVGVPALWLLVTKTIFKSAADNASTKAENAKSDVIKMLREEVARMSELNAQLSTGLRELQLENVKLQKEISHLHIMVNTMTERMATISRRDDSVFTGTDRRAK